MSADAPDRQDPADALSLVRPVVSEEQAVRMALDCYGLVVTASELGSNQDRNFLVTTPTGERFVLKVDNSAFAPAELAAQNDALTLLAGAGVPVSDVHPGADGRPGQTWHDQSVRLFTYAGDETLYTAGYLAPVVVGELGRLAGRLVRTLAGFDHDGLDRETQWDLRRAAVVVDGLIGSVADESRRAQIRAVVGPALAAVGALAGSLPVQAIHGDLTPDNVVARRGSDSRLHPDVVIDFGDLARSWRVGEIAVTCTSLLHHQVDSPYAVLPAIRAFHEEVGGLTEAEARAVWPLVVLRAAVLVVSGEHQVTLESDNAYAGDRTDAEWLVFTVAAAIDPAEATELILAELGLAEPPESRSTAHPLLPALADGYHRLDLTPESSALDDGRWLEAGAEAALVSAALAESAVVLLPYGGPRMTRTRPDRRQGEPTIPLFTEIHVASEQPVQSPADAVVELRAGDRAELRLATGSLLVLDGVRLTVGAGDTLAAGQPVGTVRSGLPLRVSVRRPDLPESPPAAPSPAFTTSERFGAWARITPDPAALLGLEGAPHPDTARAERVRRERVFSSAQERYYADPPQIERGWRHHLVDTTGRSYVDMVNNVTAVGHGHPRITAAVAGQIARLNTNSRFLYRLLAELSERLVDQAPGPDLDTVLLVNSGTEAVDLALRLAWTATGRRTVVALREAYHGWSIGSDAISTSAYDNPHAVDSRPDWVHVADAPHPLRGRHSGPDAGPRYAADVATDIERLATEGRPVAAYICEAILGNAGGVLLPEGYLSGVYAAVRAAGGVCIADEVQVGYGRTGDHFWGFQRQGVVPDLITCAKPMGNGYPIGAVITSRRIAESIAEEGTFFSSAGGSPASCAAGIAVLDVLRDERLQENAKAVGDHLRGRLLELGERHPIIAAVHGAGLYLGVELVRDRETLEPAAAETAAICERLLELGVIVQPTSERQNVLKIKPPLCLSMESADFVVDRIDEVLSHGW